VTSEEPVEENPAGRPRDPAIDDAVLDETIRQLARDGLAALSLAAVAAAAGTSRPAIYRRWPNKEALVVDAISRLAQVDSPEVSDDPFEALVGELDHFRHCIMLAGSLPVAGLMLTEGVDKTILDRYRAQIVGPRRARIRSCLRHAVDIGAVDPDADVDIASTFLTGSWYALALAGTTPPDDWARRTAALVWRACGGAPSASTG
jgi:AcrR family transcriptional regulator